MATKNLVALMDKFEESLSTTVCKRDGKLSFDELERLRDLISTLETIEDIWKAKEDLEQMKYFYQQKKKGS